MFPLIVAVHSHPQGVTWGCNNQNVLHGKKKEKNWVEKGVVFVLDLLKKDASLYAEFIDFFGVDSSPKVYDWVINSISPKLLHMVR